jgi:hypothetical protein
MRELIYLSERKLSEFRQERRRGFRVRELGVPGFGQVGIEQQGDSHLGRRLLLHGSPDHLIGTPPGTRLPAPSVSLGPVLSRTLAAYVNNPDARPLLGRLLDHLADPYEPELAARMTGFARVTAVGDGGVVASPLSVAYARQ